MKIKTKALQIIKKVQNYMDNNAISIFLLFSFALIICFIPETSFAKEAAKETSTDAIQEMISGMGMLTSVLWSLFYPFLLMIGALMDNSLIFGGDMGSTLHLIWLEMRDIVNILFVIVLIIIAIYNVFGFGGDSSLSMKSALPKVVLALIVINFTYFAARVTLDIVNVATISTFSLASDISDWGDFKVKASTDVCNTLEKQYRSIDINTDTKRTDEHGNRKKYYEKHCKRIGETGKKEEELIGISLDSLKDKTKRSDSKIYTGSLTGYLTGGHFKEERSDEQQARDELALLTEIRPDNFAIIIIGSMANVLKLNDYHRNADNWEKLAISSLFSIISTLIFGVAIALLLIILLVRIIVLWIAIALSPLYGLKIAFPNLKLGGAGGDFVQKLVKTIMAPILIGFCFSIGFLLMNAWYTVANVAEDKSSLLGQMKQQSIESVSSNLLINGVSTFDDLFMMIAILVVIWKGVEMASSGTFASFITDTITDRVKSFASYAAKVPTHAPIFKTDAGNLSLQGGLNTVRETFQKYEDAGRKSYQERSEGIAKENQKAQSQKVKNFSNGAGPLTKANVNDYALGDKSETEAFDKRMAAQFKSKKGWKRYQKDIGKANKKTGDDRDKARHEAMVAFAAKNNDFKKLWGKSNTSSAATLKASSSSSKLAAGKTSTGAAGGATGAAKSGGGFKKIGAGLGIAGIAAAGTLASRNASASSSQQGGGSAGLEAGTNSDMQSKDDHKGGDKLSTVAPVGAAYTSAKPGEDNTMGTNKLNSFSHALNADDNIRKKLGLGSKEKITQEHIGQLEKTKNDKTKSKRERAQAGLLIESYKNRQKLKLALGLKESDDIDMKKERVVQKLEETMSNTHEADDDVRAELGLSKDTEITSREVDQLKKKRDDKKTTLDDKAKLQALIDRRTEEKSANIRHEARRFLSEYKTEQSFNQHGKVYQKPKGVRAYRRPAARGVDKSTSTHYALHYDSKEQTRVYTDSNGQATVIAGKSQQEAASELLALEQSFTKSVGSKSSQTRVNAAVTKYMDAFINSVNGSQHPEVGIGVVSRMLIDRRVPRAIRKKALAHAQSISQKTVNEARKQDGL